VIATPSTAMAFACNIDRRGRSIRTIAGAVTLLAGLALLAAPMFLGGEPDGAGTPQDAADRISALLVGGIAACCGGAFMLFEGLVGWCAVRAMGFKTPV
jgi:hypothetical protein